MFYSDHFSYNFICTCLLLINMKMYNCKYLFQFFSEIWNYLYIQVHINNNIDIGEFLFTIIFLHI